MISKTFFKKNIYNYISTNKLITNLILSMVKIKFLSQNKFSSLNQFDLFGSNETGCIYIRENNYNRKNLSADC